MHSEKSERVPESEELEPRKIILDKVIPVISSYIEQLSNDPSELAQERDYLLGEMSRKDLERNNANLKRLQEFLRKFADNPDEFRLTFRNDRTNPFKHTYLLSLRDPEDPPEFSTNSDLPDTEFNIQLVLLKKEAPELSEGKEERLRSLGRNVPPERALERSQEQAPKEMTLYLTATQVYWQKRERGPSLVPGQDHIRRINYESGVALCWSSQEGSLSYGVFYLGATPHYSRIYEETKISQKECKVLKDFFLQHFEKRNQERIPSQKFRS